MNRIGVLLCIALMAVACNGQRKAPKESEPAPAVEPEMTGEQMDSLYRKAQSVVFEDRIYDCGDIQEKDGNVTRRFVYTNNSDSPVVIYKYLTPCKCTFADFGNEPVAPGKKGEVMVTYNPYGRPGRFSEEISFFFSDSIVRRVHIKGNVIPFNHPVTEDHPYELGNGLYSNLKIIKLGGIRPSQDALIIYRLANGTDKQMEIGFSAPEHLRDNLIFPETLTLAPDERITLNVGYHMPDGVLGLQNVGVQITVNGRLLPKPLTLQAVGIPQKTGQTPDSPVLSYKESSFQFKSTSEAQPFEIELTNSGKSTLWILAASLPEGITSELAKDIQIRPGETRSFRSSLLIPDSYKGDYHDCIYIVTNDPVRPYLGINLNTI